jgi:hypothetical protein
MRFRCTGPLGLGSSRKQQPRAHARGYLLPALRAWFVRPFDRNTRPATISTPASKRRQYVGPAVRPGTATAIPIERQRRGTSDTPASSVASIFFAASETRRLELGHSHQAGSPKRVPWGRNESSPALQCRDPRPVSIPLCHSFGWCGARLTVPLARSVVYGTRPLRWPRFFRGFRDPPHGVLGGQRVYSLGVTPEAMVSRKAISVRRSLMRLR